MSPEAIAIAKLKALVKQHSSQQAAAEALGITPQYFGDLLRGRRECSEKVLAKLGLRRIVVPK